MKTRRCLEVTMLFAAAAALAVATPAAAATIRNVSTEAGLQAAIAEVNADKFGAYTPGTHIPIISEAEAHGRNPDYFLVMPWHFRENLIQREAAYLKRGGKMIFPLPEISVVEL